MKDGTEVLGKGFDKEHGIGEVGERYWVKFDFIFERRDVERINKKSAFIWFNLMLIF